MKALKKSLESVFMVPLSLAVATVASPFVAVAAIVATIVGFPCFVCDYIWKREEGSDDGRQQD